MAQLSDREIEEAAREAGITPAELRSAMSQQEGGGELAHRGGRGMLPPSPRGQSAAHSETTLPYAPEQAVRSVKRQIERETGSKGHMMGSTEADINDESNGVIYRVQAESDGAGGSLVRVDIDPTPAQARRTLTGMGIGATAGLLAIAGIIIPGILGTALVGGALGLCVLGVMSIIGSRRRGISNARSATAQALVEAEHGAPIGGAQLDEGDEPPRALPPGSS